MLKNRDSHTETSEQLQILSEANEDVLLLLVIDYLQL